MYTQLLERLGLSPNEAKIYQSLIQYGGNTVSTISLRAKVHRRNVYDSLNRLVEKGLAYRVFSQDGDQMYEAVAPVKLKEIIEEEERLLDRHLPSMLQVFRDHRVPQRAYIYKGYEGVKNYLHQILTVGKDIHSIGGKGILAEPQIQSFVKWYSAERKKQKQKHFHLWDAELRDDSPVPLGTKGRYKFMDARYSTPSTMDIFGDYIATFSGVSKGHIEEDVTIFMIVSPRLADTYRTWWQMMWDLLPEVSAQKRGNKGQKRLKTT